MRRTLLIVIPFLAVVAAAGIGLTKRLTGSWFPSTTSATNVGPAPVTSGRGVTIELSDHPVPMPAFSLTDLDGRTISADTGRGKVVLVNFWATWCGPCREEIPTLIAMQEHYGDELQIIGLSIDTKPPDEVRQFARQFNLNYPVAIATPEIIDAFGGVPAVPATFVITPDGNIVQRHIGLLNPMRTEHEVRVLAKLTTDAEIKYVKDTGQVLLENAAYATEIPGLDLSALTPALKEEALKRLNAEHCTCGCGLTLAQCRINDPSCTVSLPVAQKLVKDLNQKPAKDLKK